MTPPTTYCSDPIFGSSAGEPGAVFLSPAPIGFFVANAQPSIEYVLVPAVTPEFCDRGLLWWRDNAERIRRAAHELPWWSDHIVVLEQDEEVSRSRLLRTLDDMGYERVQRVEAPGEVAVRGGVVDLFPIGREHPVRMELAGSIVDALLELSLEVIEREAEQRARYRADQTFLRMLRPGDYVVHADHGIGIFKERITKRMTPSDEPQPYVVLQYAKSDTLAVPEAIATEKLTKYIGFRSPTIHRLGGRVWMKTKRAARKSAEQFARKLLALYAEREQAQGTAFPPHDAVEDALAESFPHNETPDQARAIQEVFDDMQRGRPMDRLLCGDVGFGKTEVVVRAAFKAAHAGKQVALLAPTTILAHQHYETLQERLSDMPVRTAMLSRLLTSSEEDTVLDAMQNGSVDIVVGTHRLLSDDVTFRDLGLVVIDEEQRFGVRQKETFREAHPGVDVLAVSATPIPRTMHMAMAGLRDISIIATPPPGRVPIETVVGRFSRDKLNAALERELDRNGQVYVLHNRVTSIEAEAQRIRRDHPDVVVDVAHGQLPEQELLGAIQRFSDGATQVLVATTIIENGLDFSHVNTLAVKDASRLGLAQTHQIRGRVGRGDRKAYAHFFVPNKKLTPATTKRLQVLQEAMDLGAGYEIAVRDLELRGAGNLLGKEQSGTAYRVGVNLYCQMLAEAIEHQRSV